MTQEALEQESLLDAQTPYDEQLEAEPLVMPEKTKCAICGKTAIQNTIDRGEPLCREHTFSKGRIWVLDMSNDDPELWGWIKETR